MLWNYNCFSITTLPQNSSRQVMYEIPYHNIKLCVALQPTGEIRSLNFKFCMIQSLFGTHTVIVMTWRKISLNLFILTSLPYAFGVPDSCGICVWRYSLRFAEHYSDVIMSAIASQITSVSIVYSNICSGARRPVTRSFDVSFDLRLNKRLSKQPWGWWF